MLLYEFFSAVVCTVVSSAALGYCYSWPNFNRRRQDVLDCTWKSKYYRYRHVVPDLPAKSSSLGSSIARHWGHRIKWIARWGNKIAFWGKQFKTIAFWGKRYSTFLECSLPSTVSKNTINMIGHRSRLRDVMGQSYLICACIRANHARYSSVHVTFCGSSKHSL